MLKHELHKNTGDYLREILADCINPTILELGVHWGEDTHKIMNLCSTAPTYYGFEPDPRNIQRIKQKMGVLPYKLNLIEGAVGNKNEVIDFYLSDGNHPTNGNLMTGANSIRKPKVVKDRHAWIKFNKEIKVQCHTLDEYFKDKNIDCVDFIWCDIQGAEYDMIQGAKNILSKTKYAYLEYSDVELYEGQKKIEDYLKLLNETGDWELVHKFQIDVLFQNKSLLNKTE